MTVIVVILFVVAVEGGMRLAGVKYDASFYRLEREYGYVLRPGAEGWNVKEHENYVRISSQGLRDREHSPRRPAGVIRIAVVGDSFSEAREVQQDRTYWSVMERELNRLLPDGSPRVEVINFGVDGYGLSQEYLVIKDKVWRFDPRIIILSGTLHSFILRNNRKFGTVAAEGPVPYFVPRNGGLALDDLSEREQSAFMPPGHWSDVAADLTNESRVLSLVNAARRKVAAGAENFPPFNGVRRSGPAGDPKQPAPSPENEVLRGPVDADLGSAWSVGEELIRASHAEASHHEAEFWLLLLDMAPQVDPDAERRSLVMRELAIDDLFLADKLLAEFAEREGINHRMLAPSLLAYAEAHHVVLHGFKNRPRNTGHWNETGHAVAGLLTAQSLFDCSGVIGRHRATTAAGRGGCTMSSGSNAP